MWAIADGVTDEAAIRQKAQDILDTFDIEGGGTVEKVWDMARYLVAFEAWVKMCIRDSSSYSAWISGISARQGGHQVPQKFRKTTFPW